MKALAVVLALIIAVTVIGGAYAASNSTDNNQTGEPDNEAVAHTYSSYAELVLAREQAGHKIMPMVTDDTSLQAKQEHRFGQWMSSMRKHFGWTKHGKSAKTHMHGKHAQSDD